MLYPFRGLDITDDDHDLADPNPLFGDASIVSKAQLPKLVDRVELVSILGTKKLPAIVDEEQGVTTDEAENFNSLIAVRVWGPSRLSTEMRAELAHDADRRSYQVASLITLVILGHWLLSNTTALVSQLHRGRRTRVMYNLESEYFYGKVSAVQSFAALSVDSALKFSRQELMKLLRQEEFVGLTEVLGQPTQRAEPLRQAIQAASVRLAEAVHSIVPSSQLLGAVTALELLLTSDQRYKTTKRRITALIGDQAREFRVNEIVDARNQYVHYGKEVTDEPLARNAVYLALACLLRYSNLASEFQNKEDLFQYLDFVASGILFRRAQGFPDYALLAQGWKHDPEAPIFPYERGIDEDPEDDPC